MSEPLDRIEAQLRKPHACENATGLPNTCGCCDALAAVEELWQQKPCLCCDEDKSFYETEGYCFNTDHAPAMAEHFALVRERDQLRAQVEELQRKNADMQEDMNELNEIAGLRAQVREYAEALGKIAGDIPHASASRGARKSIARAALAKVEVPRG